MENLIGGDTRSRYENHVRHFNYEMKVVGEVLKRQQKVSDQMSITRSTKDVKPAVA